MNKLLLLMIAVLLVVTPAYAANPGHSASAVGAGTFESGNYAFPAQLDVTGNFIVDTETFFIGASTDRVGIGTVSPDSLLHVYSNATNAVVKIEADGNDDSAQITIDRPQANRRSNLVFSTADSADWALGTLYAGGGSNSVFSIANSTNLADSMFVIDTSGNVGIGDTAPSYTLDVNGTARFTGAVTVPTPSSGTDAANKDYVDSQVSGAGTNESAVEGYVYDSDNTLSGTWSVAASGANDINFDSNTFYIDSNESRIGVGTSSPAAKIHLTEVTENEPLLYITGYNNDGTTEPVILVRDENANVDFSVAPNNGVQARILSVTETFNVNSASSTFNLDNLGSTGINDYVVNVVQSSSLEPQIRLISDERALDSGDLVGGIEYFADDTESGVAYPLALIAGEADGSVTSGSGPGRLVFSTTGSGSTSTTERLVIDSSGDVGIATTSPSYRLDVNGTARFTGAVTVPTPSSGTDAANKDYVDAQVGGAGTNESTVEGYVYDNDNVATNWTVQASGNNQNVISLENSAGTTIFDVRAAGSPSYGVLRLYDQTGSQEAQIHGYTGNTYFAATGGNVGIGTNSPSQKFQVDSGNILVRGTDNFVSGGDTANIYFGDTNHFIGAESGQGLHLSTYQAPSAVFIEQTTGYVGINQTSPGYTFDVSGTARFTEDVIVENNLYVMGYVTNTNVDNLDVNGSITPQGPFDNTFDLGNSTNRWRNLYLANDLEVDTNTLFVDASEDRVGIGTTSPGEELYVVGDINATGDICITGGNCLSSVGSGTVGGSGTTNYLPRWSASSTLTDSSIYDNGTAVGIGTSSPNVNLHIVDSESGSAPALLRLQNTGTTTGTGSSILFSMNSVGSPITTGAITSVSSSGTNDGYLSFSTRESATISERMRISASGNVGIGTTSPSELLHINDSSLPTIKLTTPNSGSASTDGFELLADTGGNAYVFNREAAPLIFGTSNDEKLRITSDGNVGIGTTSPGEKLDIQGGNLAINNDGSGSVSILVGDTNDIGILRFLRNGPNYIDAQATNGALAFRTGSTPTERMRIDQNGNVGIGTASPGEKLEVNGSINVTTGNDVCIEGGNCLSTAGSGSGNVSGSGTANYVPRWSDSSTLTDSSIYDDGSSVGIGTQSPVSALNVNGSSNVNITVSTSTNTGNSGLFIADENGNTDQFNLYYNQPNNQGYLTTNGNGLRIFSSQTDTTIAQFGLASDGYDNSYFAGNLGVGTSNPDYRLSVNGGTSWMRLENSDYDGSTTGTAMVVTSGAASGNTYGRIQVFNSGGGSAGDLVLQNSGGNVGIGTSSPDSELHVSGDAPVLTIQGSDASYTNAAIQLISDHASNARGMGIFSFINNSDVEWFYGNPYNGNDAFVINRRSSSTPSSESSPVGIGSAPGSSTTLFKVSSEGEIGVGTSTPAATLDVDGNFTLASGAIINEFSTDDTLSGDSDSAVPTEQAVKGYVDAQVLAGTVNESAVEDYIYDSDNTLSGTWSVSASGANDINFDSNTFYIDSSENNIGIGTATPDSQLTITNTASIDFDNDAHTGENLFVRSTGVGEGDGNPTGMIAFGKHDSSSGRTGSAIVGIQTDADADRVGLGFYTSPSSASSQTLQEAVRITHDGNVGIGTTDPETKLDVFNGIVQSRSSSNSAGFKTVKPDAWAVSGFEITNGTDYTVRLRDKGSSDGAVLLESGNGRALSVVTELNSDIPLTLQGSTINLKDADTPYPVTVSVTNNRVGIGTTSPGEKLEVNGSINVTSGNDVCIEGGNCLSEAGSGSGNLSGSGATNQVAFFSDASTLSSESNLFWDSSSDELGIGDTSPDAKLHVNGNAADLNGLIIQNSGGSANDAARIQFDVGSDSSTTNGSALIRVERQGTSGADLEFWTSSGVGSTVASAQRMTITKDGNIGIGTSTPNEFVEIRRSSDGSDTSLVIVNSAGTGSTDETAEIKLAVANNLDAISRITAGRDDSYSSSSNRDSNLQFWTSLNEVSSERVRITSSGNVGIGTDSPTSRLGIQDSSSSTTLTTGGSILKLANTDSTADNIAAIDFPTSASGAGFSRIGAIYEDRTGSSEDQSLFFRTIGGGSSQEVMRLSSTGNVGIGTTSPSSPLHVQRSNSDITVPLVNLTNDDAGTGQGKVLYVKGGAGTTSSYIAQFVDDSDNNVLLLNGSGDAVLGNDNELYVDTSQNRVGIGTSSPGGQLEISSPVGYGLYITDSGNGNNQSFGIYVDSSSDDYGSAAVFKNTNTGTTVTQLEGRQGRDSFINNGGSVGIGTASPAATLDVNGNITLASGAIINEFSTDDTLAGDSDSAVPTEQAVKGYVDTQIAGVGTDESTAEGWIYDGDNTLGSTWSVSASGSNDFDFDSNTFYIDSSENNVGLGVSNPTHTLQIRDDVGTAISAGSSISSGMSGMRFTNFDNTADAGIVLSFQMGASGTAYSAIAAKRTSASNSELNFFVEDADTQLQALTIASDGDVGIGTTSPAYQLDVNGSVRVGQRIYSSSDENGNTYVEFDTNDIDFIAKSRQALTIDLQNDDGVIVNQGGDALVSFRVESAASQNSFFVNGTSGNVGIGVSNGTRPFTFENGNARIAFEEGQQFGAGPTAAYGPTITLESTGPSGGPNAWSGYTKLTFDENGFLIDNYGELGGPQSGPGGIGFRTGNVTTDNPDVFIDRYGNLGIGTVSPSALLDINASSGNLITASGSTGTVFTVDNSGEVFSDGGYSTPAADLAEAIPVSEEVEPGDVMIIDVTKDETLKKSHTAYDTLVAGIVSTQPGVKLGSSGEYIALAGRVPVKVVGPVQRGDLLVTSNVAGRAMRCTQDCSGAVLGKALTNSENNMVTALVTLQ